MLIPVKRDIQINIPLPREAPSTGCCMATRCRFSGVGKYSDSLLGRTESLSSSDSLTSGPTVDGSELLNVLGQQCRWMALDHILCSPATYFEIPPLPVDLDCDLRSVLQKNSRTRPDCLFLFPSWLICLFLAEKDAYPFL